MLTGLAATAGIALSGCETADHIDTTAEMATATTSSDTSIVFGRVRWIENGQERQMDQSMMGWSIQPRLRRLEDGTMIHGKVDPGGRFRWSLPPGTYVMDRINYRDPMTGQYFIVPQVGFSVPRGGAIFYAGTLRAQADVERGFFGVDGATQFSVQDEFSAELHAFKAEVGSIPGTVEESLMVQDDTLPVSLDSTAESQLALTILGALL